MAVAGGGHRGETGVMDSIKSFLDLFLHVNEHLEGLVTAWGPWTYVVLFAIIFCETGLVVTPFLPGDSLLFAAGAMAHSLFCFSLN